MAYYIMQAVSSSNGQLYSWRSAVVDFIASGYPGPGSPLNVTLVSFNPIDNINVGISYHDLTHNPVGLWQFNGNLNDSSGNGFTLTEETAVGVQYTEMYPGKQGCRLRNNIRLRHNATPAALQITGDITIEMLISPSAFGGGATDGYFVSCGNNGATAADNILYAISNTTANGFPRWSHETGTASGRGYILTENIIPFALCHFAATRTSGVIQFYLNGLPFGAASSALTAPTGGGSSQFRVGFETGSNTAIASLASLKVINSALSAAQIKAEYNRTLGPAFGVI